MKITKLWHCCLLIETKGKRFLTDPGCFTVEAHSQLDNIDAILFTHEHADHYHLDSLRQLLEKNPEAQIFANTSVSELLTQENISHITILDGQTLDFAGISLTGYWVHHEEMHRSIPLSANTGFMVGEQLFYPGDAFTIPGCPVDILALPVAGPWMKLWQAVDYALAVKPRIAFPVHDSIRYGISHLLPARILAENGIEFIPMVEGDSHEF